MSEKEIEERPVYKTTKKFNLKELKDALIIVFNDVNSLFGISDASRRFVIKGSATWGFKEEYADILGKIEVKIYDQMVKLFYLKLNEQRLE